MQLAEAVAAMVGTTVREIRNGTLCWAVHPDDGARCVLKVANTHRLHKTGDCRRWEDVEPGGRVAGSP